MDGVGENEYLKSYINNKYDSELGDIVKIRGRLLMALLIIGILSCVTLPSVNAETFDIGEKMDSDLKLASPVYHPFTSGAIVRADEFEINLTTFIFDGNLSTGIETNYIMGDLDWKVYFRFPLYVNNITIKPSFGNGSSNFTLRVFVVDTIDREFTLGFDTSGEKVYQMNCFVSAIDLSIHENGTDQFYFNDLIIDYTPTLPYLGGFQNQINNLTAQLNLFNNMINELNNSINDMNQTQDEIIENVTTLSATYIQLNESFSNFINEIQSLDNRIFQIESENAALSIEIENLTTEVEELKEAQDEPDDFVVLVPFILSFLAILIAIVAIILASRKSGENTPPADKEESEESIHSEENKNKTNEEES